MARLGTPASCDCLHEALEIRAAPSLAGPMIDAVMRRPHRERRPKSIPDRTAGRRAPNDIPVDREALV